MDPSKSFPSKLRLSEQGLQQIDAQLHRMGWRKQSKHWANVATVSLATLKRFRGRNRISADAFQALCQALGIDWRDVVEAYDPEDVDGDDPEPGGRSLPAQDEVRVDRGLVFEQLLERLRRGCRVLVIAGITGIGKTVLTEQLTQTLQPQVGPEVHINFDIRPQARFVDVAACCLEREGQLVTDKDRQQPQQIMVRWLDLLLHQPRWVVFDSVEQILKGDEQKGWSVFEDPLWEDFFHRILGWETCRSQFILTSQDIPAPIEIQGRRYTRHFHVESISGLPLLAQGALFQAYGFQPSQAVAWGYLQRIGRAYEGHPLALHVIIGEIMDCHDGDVTAYWRCYGNEIILVESDRVAAYSAMERPRLDRYSRQLRKAVRDRIEKTFVRLREDFPGAYLLLCMAAVYRVAVDRAFLLAPLERWGYTGRDAHTALETLLERHLLEIDKHGKFRQHNLIRSVALDHFDRLNPAPSDESCP
jgi:hypothetical protein